MANALILYQYGQIINKAKVNSQRDDNPTLTQALDLYLKLKGQGRDRVFFRTARRYIRYVIIHLGVSLSVLF